jgi:hypothetical protein
MAFGCLDLAVEHTSGIAVLADQPLWGPSQVRHDLLLVSHGRLHITGMGTSYVLLLTAFYVDNGKSLPIWRDLPPLAYWLVPAGVGIPLIVRALLWHPLASTPRPASPP